MAGFTTPSHRNGTEYRCVLFNNMGTRLNENDPIILYVAGEYQYNMYTVIFSNYNNFNKIIKVT